MNNPMSLPVIEQPSILETGLAQVRASLAHLPPDRRVAVVGTLTDNLTVRAGVAARIGNEWVFAADFEKKLSEAPTIRAFVEWSR